LHAYSSRVPPGAKLLMSCGWPVIVHIYPVHLLVFLRRHSRPARMHLACVAGCACRDAAFCAAVHNAAGSSAIACITVLACVLRAGVRALACKRRLLSCQLHSTRAALQPRHAVALDVMHHALWLSISAVGCSCAATNASLTCATLSDVTQAARLCLPWGQACSQRSGLVALVRLCSLSLLLVQ
jgi:hypothetical protein